MANNNRTCYLCGRAYSYCPNCEADRDKPSWYDMWCSETCKEINAILQNNNFGRLTDEAAAEKLSKIELPDIQIRENAVRISKLLAERKKAAAAAGKTADKKQR